MPNVSSNASKSGRKDYICKVKHYTFPIFVPELACPNRCVFCNQNSISGCYDQPSLAEVRNVIENRLSTMPVEDDNCHIEIGFFGGNFTGIDEFMQREYLSLASSYLREGKIRGIRLSTRPDYITDDSLKLLNEYSVTTIELGAQSLDDEVLKLAGRGHTVADVERASGLIKGAGYCLGLQMMTGLPGDTKEKSLYTARRIIELGAECTRIYPTLVIKGTELEDLYRKGLYKPQSLEEAVSLAADLYVLFKDAGVDIIRMGLHPSENLTAENDLLAGPFHISFRQLVESEIWRRYFALICDSWFSLGILPEKEDTTLTIQDDNILIEVSTNELNQAIGYNGHNRDFLHTRFRDVIFKVKTVNQLSEVEKIARPLIIAAKGIPLPAKNELSRKGHLYLLEGDSPVYKSISNHPDIYICQGAEKAVISPDTPQGIIEALRELNFPFIFGSSSPQKQYPGSARYNAVVTKRLIIHNFRITDPIILEVHSDKERVNVKQGYTRCNLLPLECTDGTVKFITSDFGIKKVLDNLGYEVFYADPAGIVLKGQKHGFFPGCCGILKDVILINGSLDTHPDGEAIRNFIVDADFRPHELFKGRLTDVGSILSFLH